MPKLSTKELKKLISQWLSTPERLKQMEYEFQQDVTYERLWCDGNKWRRVEKATLKDAWVDWFRSIEYENFESRKYKYIPCFNLDMMGECDASLVTKYFNNPELAEKCILRSFMPADPLDNNYCLEIVTTPEDDVIVGWTVIVD